MVKEKKMKIHRSISGIVALLLLGLSVTASLAQGQEIQFSALPAEKVKASSITILFMVKITGYPGYGFYKGLRDGTVLFRPIIFLMSSLPTLLMI
jgi:hypothetical protein